MPNTIRHKRSATSGAAPAAGSLSTGELAINTADGAVYLKTDDGNVSTVKEPRWLAATPLSTAPTNDWNPGTYGDVVSFSSTTNLNITGIVKTFRSKVITLINTGTFTVGLLVNNSSSAAGNRFYHGFKTSQGITANGSLTIMYDPLVFSGVGGWRILDYLPDGTYGNISVTQNGATFTLVNDSVTATKILDRNVTATKLGPQPYTTYASQTLNTLLYNMVAITAATTVTVPANATTNIGIGYRVDFVQTNAGSGQLTIAPAAGVTISGANGLKTRTQWSVLSLLKIATDQWLVFGDTMV